MPSFLSDITPFLGTGVRNEEGQDLEKFLDAYNPGAFECPSVTADVLVFQYNKLNLTVRTGLKLLMIQRKNHPSIGYWALPGGFVNIREDIEEAAKRELYEETGLKDIGVTQLYCWGAYDRDPRTRIITVSYLAMVEEGLSVKAGDDAADALWFDVSVMEGVKNLIESGIRYDTYEIEMKNKEKDITLKALVQKETDTNNIFADIRYKVLQSQGIAFDHPCFILQAIDKINSIFKRNLI